MKDIISDPEMVACCGLYCGACGKYRKDKCPGCRQNQKAGWCKIRPCCLDHKYLSCADCAEFSDPRDCKKFNNLMSKLFGLVFRSDRAACIDQIRRIGLQGHADYMSEHQRQSIKRGKHTSEGDDSPKGEDA